MGMDLFSKWKPRGGDNLYYRFNWTGWRRVTEFLSRLGCDLSQFSGSNDGDLVDPDSCEAVAERLAQVKGQLKTLMTCPGNQLKAKAKEIGHVYIDGADGPTGADENAIPKVDLVKFIVETRLGLAIEAPRKARKLLADETVVVVHRESPVETATDAKPMDVKLLEYSDGDGKTAWTDWDRLAYYLAFGDYCMKCSNLGGFKQC